MKMRRCSFLTSAIGLCVLVPCAAQEPAQRGDDPFGRGTAASVKPPRGFAEVKRADVKVVAKADADGALKPEERIRNELGNKTTISFIDVPLSDAATRISQAHEIPIVIDSRALSKVGLSSNEKVDLSVKNVSLRSALRLLLNGRELTYMIRDEVLLITTVASAEQTLSVRDFPLSPPLIGNEEEVIKTVQANVVPDIWQSKGGPANIVRVSNTLVVSATEQVLEDVESLLEKLTGDKKETSE